jgi:hypothetical protein
MNPAPPATTVLGQLLASLAQACSYNRDDQVPPAVLLWTDAEGQWEPLLPRLRGLLPQLLTLGPYEPATRTSPAIWLRCLLARTLPGVEYWPEGATPIVYLPGVSRPELRAVESCPPALQPLAGLQYLGAFWAHPNGKDWTVAAFLQSERGGLGLDLARDADILDMLRTALPELADQEVDRLRGKQLSAEDFQALVLPDPVRQLLRWLDDPAGARGQWGPARWKAFRGACRKAYHLDPEDADAEEEAAQKLGLRGGKWEDVWQRFAESPALYPRLPGRLRAARPAAGLFDRTEAWPQDNEQEEKALRQALHELPSLPPPAARAAVAELEARHGRRRDWVWARLGQAPLARALRHLGALAAATEQPLAGATAAALAEAYAAGGWRADDSALAALAEVRAADDVAATQAAVLALYRPWLESTTERFQALAPESLDHPRQDPKRRPPPKGRCLLFADGLRYDVGQRLRAELAGRGLLVEAVWHWAALPPVTPTAKPAISPVTDLLEGVDGDGFCPSVVSPAPSHKPDAPARGPILTTERFRQLLAGRGYQVLAGNETGADPGGLAWAEAGQIDRTGHEEGWKLAWRIDEEVRALAERVAGLLAAGWKEVQVVTDHGWLLLPGGLPKCELPAFLTEDRWGRCALLAAGSTVGLPRRPWHWSPDVWVALAPGITCFVAGKEYAHGSLSLQECLVPQLLVRAPVPVGPAAVITSVRWTGLRCRVVVEGDADGLRVDVRTRPADASSSLAVPKAVGSDGAASLLVEDDGAEGAAAVVVLVTADGRVVARHATTVGVEG